MMLYWLLFVGIGVVLMGMALIVYLIGGADVER